MQEPWAAQRGWDACPCIRPTACPGVRTTYKINSVLLAMSCPYHPCCALKSASSASAATVCTSLPGAGSRPLFVFPEPSDLRGCLGCFSSPIIRLMDLKKRRRRFRLCRFVKSSRTILFSRPFKEKSMCNSQVPLSAGGMGGRGRAVRKGTVGRHSKTLLVFCSQQVV